MYEKRKQRIYLICAIMIIIGMGISNLFLVVSAINIADSPEIFIDSRLKLWDNNEKMLDKNFNITIIYLNESNNNSFNYEININDLSYKGNSTMYYLQNITISDTDFIFKFQVIINNITYLDESGIIITSGIQSSDIINAGKPFTINLRPSEWNSKEWNIFFGLAFSGLMGLPISYKLVKRIRKKNGINTIR